MQPRADWFVTSGARDLRDSSAINYKMYLHNSEYCDSTHFGEDLRQIELDLPRTGESIRLFLLTQKERETLQEDEEVPQHVMQRLLPQLKNILMAYSVRNPRVGYVQGHADVLCFLLGNVNERRNEEEVFWVYASVIERIFPEDYFARTPKLHGFHVDCKLYLELVLEKLVPLYPILSKADLPLVTSLLSCKWFVSLWIGELPVPLLYEVWDTMVREDDGTILHLLVALHFFRLALDNIQAHMETEQWDSSYVYKIILDQCQCATEIAPQELIHQARTLYGLKDESVEDLRAALRRLPQLRNAEFAILAKQTHFNYSEMERLQDEFTFLRYQRKMCGRSHVRGLKQEELENIFLREYNTWPNDIYGRIYRFIRPDGYGNISYFSLVQLLSIASRGTLEEKAHLLFQVSTQQRRAYLDHQDIAYLADLLCCLLTNQIVESSKKCHTHGYGHLESVFDAAKSPLLQRHFRDKLLSLATSDGQLQHAKWIKLAYEDSEIAQLMAWDTIRHQSNNFLCSKTRSWSFRKTIPIQPALKRASSDSMLHHPKRLSENDNEIDTDKCASVQMSNVGINYFEVDAVPFFKKTYIAAKERQLHITLLSEKMSRKFRACWPPTEARPLVRNPFNEPSGQICSRVGSLYTFWCQCTIN